jgi:hypothetical protein
MKKILPAFILSVVIFVLFSKSAFSQTFIITKASHTVTVSAIVGDFYLNLAGYIAPNASIVLIIDGVTARATVADASGNFSISGVLIKKDFSHFCLDAIDFRRLGESYTCFDIPPAQASVTMKDLFLSPTLGLSRTEIAEGSTAKAYGYSMPGALVTLHLNGQLLTTYADQTGYYEFSVKNLKAGNYSVYARAELDHKQSIEPTKKLTLKSLSWWEQFIAFLKDLWKKLLKFLTDLSLGPLWLLIPLIILIIILLAKLLPGRFDKHPLHHKWWMGY